MVLSPLTVLFTPDAPIIMRFNYKICVVFHFFHLSHFLCVFFLNVRCCCSCSLVNYYSQIIIFYFVLFYHRCFISYILCGVLCFVLVVVPFLGLFAHHILFCIMSTWHDLLIYFTSQRNVAVFFFPFSLCRCSVASFCLFYVH